MDREEKEGANSIRVVDRRRFNSAGDSQPNSRSEEPRSEPTPTAAKAPESPQRPSNATTPSAAHEEAGYASVDFSGFVVSLATQAMVLLGEMAHPQTNTVMMDLEGARQTIDIIAILQQKTKGNLNSEEERLVSEVLASLRLAFVNKTRRGPTSK
ncbi:MAG: DUF1844 domain-containing protein [Deltaproteobacteria bacterium]|nr:DUF1844 domain-containing protein [Deltaproteobacteria bacterium]